MTLVRLLLAARTELALLLSSVAVACGTRVTPVGSWSPEAHAVYLEAEDGELSGGFGRADDATASAGRYLVPPADVTSDAVPGAALARYVVEVPTAADYVIWGRIRSPDTFTNRFWFQVDAGTWFKWRISVGDIWYWDVFHDDVNYGVPLGFALSAGTHVLTIANCVPGAALDRLYFTARGDTPPGNDTACNPPHSIQVGGVCLPSCGSQGGNTCGATVCANQTPLDAYDCEVCCHVEP